MLSFCMCLVCPGHSVLFRCLSVSALGPRRGGLKFHGAKSPITPLSFQCFPSYSNMLVVPYQLQYQLVWLQKKAEHLLIYF